MELTVPSVLRFMPLGIRYDRIGATLLPLLLSAVTFANFRRLGGVAKLSRVVARVCHTCNFTNRLV